MSVYEIEIDAAGYCNTLYLSGRVYNLVEEGDCCYKLHMYSFFLFFFLFSFLMIILDLCVRIDNVAGFSLTMPHCPILPATAAVNDYLTYLS
jgi:hypothetical protein